LHRKLRQPSITPSDLSKHSKTASSIQNIFTK
jgi:hypothetical protein